MREKYDYEIIWYGDGRIIVWGTYATEYEAIQMTKSPEAPLKRWRLMKNIYQFANQESVTEGFATKATTDA